MLVIGNRFKGSSFGGGMPQVDDYDNRFFFLSKILLTFTKYFVNLYSRHNYSFQLQFQGFWTFKMYSLRNNFNYSMI